ncbi:flagellar basal body P-ring formation chaperone FlgA [Dethiosulfovibrio salsuginis]|uniref:Flagella basal body P-ring formation protein FlgA n=1 Tax=Dethiosulfovibrio salsuginis TaxID=561720 RepID=A0A1X7IUK7_9BACT|nr:flagellar basal body P-ring formation chaperone FlgA [Dethiosulfovibrio salsuginis]SMG18813.1 flagella basal body P-ring formation protein FlgA [Dethiosulfovibrio salsuginis]
MIFDVRRVLWTRRRRMAIGLAFALCLCGRAQAVDLFIEIGSGSVVPRSNIRLSHLAQIACDRPDLLMLASSAEISPKGNRIVPGDVTSALAQAGIGGIKIKLTMADSVPFRKETDLEIQLRKAAGWPGVLEVVSDRALPAGLLLPERLYPGSPSVNLRFSTNQGEQTIPVRLRWLIPGVVAQKPIGRGDIVSPSDLAMMTVEYERNRSYYSDPAVLIGMAATRDMAKGQPFTARTIDDVEIVRSGSRVRIIHRKGGLIVSTSGRAMESGSIGDVIKVRNNRTRSIVSGTVTGPDTVEVTSNE